jgi:hypothetical protein
MKGVDMTCQVLAVLTLSVALNGSAVVGASQAAATPSGHWEGAIQIPGQELKIEIDLAAAGAGWEGTITIPAQGLKGFPLSGIAVKGETVSFAMKNVPGEPQFTGTLSKDGKAISGDFTQGGGSVPFTLTRTGDAKFERPPDSTPITKEFEGSWDGVLSVDGTTLRLVLKLASKPGGPGSGTLVSVDQGGTEIPIAAVIQSGTHLKLVIPTIVGNYDGDLKDGQLTGTWTQGPRSWPLTFKRGK